MEKDLLSPVPTAVDNKNHIDLRVKKIRDKQRVIHERLSAVNYSYKIFLVPSATHAKNTHNLSFFHTDNLQE